MIGPKFKNLYPFKSNYFTTKDGHQLHYVDEGKGPVIIMVHGNPTWSFYYRNLIKELRQNYRVIAPDHIGCGFSDKPQNFDYCLKNHVDNLKDLIRHLGVEHFSLIVHDWGGAIGFGLATARPNDVDKVVILNTAAFTDNNIPWRINICKFPVLGEQLIRRFNGFAWPATFMAVKGKMDEEVKEGYLAPYDNYHNRIATARFVKDIPMRSTHPSFQTLKNIEEKLPLVKGKKLILWGEKDFCFNMHFYNRWREIYPEAASEVYGKAGHYVLEDATKETTQRVQRFFAGE